MDKEESIKQAFLKIKQDIFSITRFLEETHSYLEILKQQLKQLSDEMALIKLKQLTDDSSKIEAKFENKFNQIEQQMSTFKQEIETKFNEKKQIEVNVEELKKAPELDILEKEWQEYKHNQKINLPSANSPREDIKELVKQALKELKNEFSTRNEGVPTDNPTNPTDNPTDNPTEPFFPMQQSVQNSPKQANIAFSTRNEGVPTDNPTHQQTNQQIFQQMLNESLSPKKPENEQEKPKINIQKNAEDLLASLDSLKKEVRLKFKRITRQEMLVFSALYSLEESGLEEIDHETIANKLNLSPSSVRDYINKLINKGIPIKKTRLNNKKIILNVSEELKKIASLSTIIKLKEL